MVHRAKMVRADNIWADTLVGPYMADLLIAAAF